MHIAVSFLGVDVLKIGCIFCSGSIHEMMSMGRWKSPHPRADHSQPDLHSVMVIVTTFQIHSAPHPWDLTGHLNLTPDHGSTLVYK